MMNLFFDTETTGLPDFRAPSDAPQQPHLVQLAMLLADSAGREWSTVNLIVRPDGWEIPAEVAAIHGITTEIALAVGVPEPLAVGIYRALLARADCSVAHNNSFDRRIMRIAALRSGATKEEIEAEEGCPTFCTMAASKPLLNLPPTDQMIAAGFSGPKAPKLAECVRFFFEEDLSGAHDALVDVRACARVFYHLESLKAAATP